MYHLPDNLPLSGVVGEFTTQIRVGQFDVQFTFGKVNFIITGRVDLVRNGEIIGSWQEGKWPDPQFYEIMNVNITRYEIPNDITIVFYFENGIEMRLMDDSDYHYEWLQITVEGTKDWWVI